MANLCYIHVWPSQIPLTCGYLVVAAAYERVKKCACVISLSMDGQQDGALHTHIHKLIIFILMARYLHIMGSRKRGTYKNIILSHAVLYEM